MNWIMTFEILADFHAAHISCRVCGLARTLRRLSRTYTRQGTGRVERMVQKKGHIKSKSLSSPYDPAQE